jgi:hypothetical protein
MLDANFSSCAGYGQTSYLQGHEIGTTKTVSSFSVATFVMSSISGDNRAAGYSNQYISTSVFR